MAGRTAVKLLLGDLMKVIYFCLIVALVSPLAEGSSQIEAFSCTSNYLYDANWTVKLNYPNVNPYTGDRFIYCDITDGKWHKCAHSFNLDKFTESDSHIFLGGPGRYSSEKLGLRIEIEKLTSVARFCIYKNSTFEDAQCSSETNSSGVNVYLDIQETGTCDIRWQK